MLLLVLATVITGITHNILLGKEKKRLCTIGLEWVLLYWQEIVFVNCDTYVVV